MNGVSMQIYVQTRSKNTDYRFLGESPPSTWWLEFREATSFEHPTLIIKRDQSGLKCYLSGITSSRIDRVGTTIRYTLVMEGDCSVQGGNEYGLHLISTWLEDVSANRTDPSIHRKLGEALDRIFDEPTVERLIASSPLANEVNDLLPKLDCNHLIKLQGTDQSGSWYGSMSSEEALNAFMQRINKLMHGSEFGFAAWLNLIGTEAQTLAQKFEGKCAVLIDDDIGDELIPIEISAEKLPVDIHPNNKQTSFHCNYETKHSLKTPHETNQLDESGSNAFMVRRTDSAGDYSTAQTINNRQGFQLVILVILAILAVIGLAIIFLQ